MGRVEGKVAFITGAARGQGRSHAVRLAEEGADILAVDVCEDIDGLDVPLATDADLQETVRLVEAAGGRIVACKADVRSGEQLREAVAEGLDAFGKIDVVVANAGVAAYKDFSSLTEDVWLKTIDVNLNGVFRTIKAALPSMIERGEGGSVVLISSGTAYRGGGLLVDYATAKTGLIGLMRSFALELAPHWIRVNLVAPSTVLTPIVDNPVFARVVEGAMHGGEPYASPDERLDAMRDMIQPRHMLPLGWVEPVDISNAVLYLASDEARYVTAEELRVDLGFAGR
jgi:SDR family mycofactocin-dependent oxidoreductase